MEVRFPPIYPAFQRSGRILCSWAYQTTLVAELIGDACFSCDGHTQGLVPEITQVVAVLGVPDRTSLT